VARDGTIIQVLELSSLLAKSQGNGQFERPKHLLIFKSGERMTGLAIDEIVCQPAKCIQGAHRLAFFHEVTRSLPNVTYA
jgi:hypothetical protein